MKAGTGFKGVMWAAGVAGLAIAILLAHTVWRGEPSALVVALGKPKACLAFLLAAAVATVACGAAAAERDARKRVVGRAILLGISGILALGIGEAGVRAWLRQTQGFNSLERLRQGDAETPIYRKNFNPLAAIVRLSENRRLVYELKPGLRMDFGHHRLETNAEGLRETRDFPETKPPRTVRIVGIGDSGMFGWNVDQGRDYLSVLETQLVARVGTGRCEVLNLAVPGYNTQQEVERLKERGLRYHPDIVIVGWSDNDFAPPFFVARHREFSEKNKSYLYSMLFYRNEFLREVASPEILRSSELDSSLVDPAVLDGVGEPGVRKAMQELAALGRQYGFRVLVFGPLNDHVEAICRDAGLTQFDTWKRVKARNYPKEHNLHAMHPSEGGHGVLGQYLADFLVSEGWVAGGQDD